MVVLERLRVGVGALGVAVEGKQILTVNRIGQVTPALDARS